MTIAYSAELYRTRVTYRTQSVVSWTHTRNFVQRSCKPHTLERSERTSELDAYWAWTMVTSESEFTVTKLLDRQTPAALVYSLFESEN